MGLESDRYQYNKISEFRVTPQGDGFFAQTVSGFELNFSCKYLGIDITSYRLLEKGPFDSQRMIKATCEEEGIYAYTFRLGSCAVIYREDKEAIGIHHYNRDNWLFPAERQINIFKTSKGKMEIKNFIKGGDERMEIVEQSDEVLRLICLDNDGRDIFKMFRVGRQAYLIDSQGDKKIYQISLDFLSPEELSKLEIVIEEAGEDCVNEQIDKAMIQEVGNVLKIISSGIKQISDQELDEVIEIDS